MHTYRKVICDVGRLNHSSVVIDQLLHIDSSMGVSTSTKEPSPALPVYLPKCVILKKLFFICLWCLLTFAPSLTSAMHRIAENYELASPNSKETICAALEDYQGMIIDLSCDYERHVKRRVERGERVVRMKTEIIAVKGAKKRKCAIIEDADKE